MESRQVGSGSCYVCGGQNPSPSLMRPCRCDRLVHAECLGGVRALESWVCPSCNTPLPVVDHQLRPSWRSDCQPCCDRPSSSGSWVHSTSGRPPPDQAVQSLNCHRSPHQPWGLSFGTGYKLFELLYEENECPWINVSLCRFRQISIMSWS